MSSSSSSAQQQQHLTSSSQQRQRVSSRTLGFTVIEMKQAEDARIAAGLPPYNLTSIFEVIPENASVSFPIFVDGSQPMIRVSRGAIRNATSEETKFYRELKETRDAVAGRIAGINDHLQLPLSLPLPSGRGSSDPGNKRMRDEGEVEDEEGEEEVTEIKSKKTTQTKTKEKENYKQYYDKVQKASSENLLCYICYDSPIHPVKLPCGNCIVCYGCIHSQVNKNKEVHEGSFIPHINYNLKLNCTACKRVEGSISGRGRRKSEFVDTDANLKGLLPIDITLVKILRAIDPRAFPDKDICPFCLKLENFKHVMKCGKTQFTCHREGCSEIIDIFNQASIQAHTKVCKHHKCNQCGAKHLTLAQAEDHLKQRTKMNQVSVDMQETVGNICSIPILHEVPLYQTLASVLEKINMHVSVAYKKLDERLVDIDEIRKESVLRLNILNRGLLNFQLFLDGEISNGSGMNLPKLEGSEIQVALSENIPSSPPYAPISEEQVDQAAYSPVSPSYSPTTPRTAAIEEMERRQRELDTTL